MEFELDIDRRNISDGMLLKDIEAVAKSLGTGSPTADDDLKHGRFHPSTVIRRFGGWRAALQKAGLTPIHNNGGIPAETALADLRAVAARLGRATVSNKENVADARPAAKVRRSRETLLGLRGWSVRIAIRQLAEGS